MEFLSEIWVWIVSALGGISLAGIITTVIYGCLKGAFNRTISKINVQKIADQATEKGVERVKEVSFTHSIQPIVESRLVEINEKATEVFEKQTEKVSDKYDKIINILDKLACYFDNSIGVADEKKAELKQAIAEAKNEQITAESVVVDEIVIETTKHSEKEPKTAKSSTKVER